MTNQEAFRVLGVSADMTLKQVQTRWRTLAQLYHPDRLQNFHKDVQDEGQRRLKDINEAIRLLKGQPHLFRPSPGQWRGASSADPERTRQEREARERAAREQAAAKERAAWEREARERAAREQADAKERAAREQAAREQVARIQATLERSERFARARRLSLGTAGICAILYYLILVAASDAQGGADGWTIFLFFTLPPLQYFAAFSWGRRVTHQQDARSEMLGMPNTAPWRYRTEALVLTNLTGLVPMWHVMLAHLVVPHLDPAAGWLDALVVRSLSSWAVEWWAPILGIVSFPPLLKYAVQTRAFDRVEGIPPSIRWASGGAALAVAPLVLVTAALALAIVVGAVIVAALALLIGFAFLNS